MERPRVLLVGFSPLFTEGLEKLLRQAEGLEVVGVARALAKALAEIETQHPDVVVLACGGEPDAASGLVADLLRVHPDLAIIRADLERDEIRVYDSHRVTARGADLLSAIRSVPGRGG